MFERLCDEHGYTGNVTIVHEYEHGKKVMSQEGLVPLSHRLGHEPTDFGEPGLCWAVGRL